jgi:hypothetical protein
MTKHITDQIETIIHKGGFVIVNLRTLVDVLEDIRSVESINREFQEAFEDIEKRRGTIHPATKKELFRYINCTEKYHHINNYDGLV